MHLETGQKVSSCFKALAKCRQHTDVIAILSQPPQAAAGSGVQCRAAEMRCTSSTMTACTPSSACCRTQPGSLFCRPYVSTCACHQCIGSLKVQT